MRKLRFGKVDVDDPIGDFKGLDAMLPRSMTMTMNNVPRKLRILLIGSGTEIFPD